jgi:hypothetical protein
LVGTFSRLAPCRTSSPVEIGGDAYWDGLFADNRQLA